MANKKFPNIKFPKIFKILKKHKFIKAKVDKDGNPLPKSEKGKKIKRIIIQAVIACMLLAIAFGIAGGVCFTYILENYENIEIAEAFRTLNMNETSYIYAYDEEMGIYVEVESLYLNEDRRWISFDEIPEYFIDATVAIEDENFYEHNGVDWRRFILATANQFLKFRSSFGASTITMQLVKNITGADDRTWQRKAQEVFNATYIETLYSKDDILELYLNYINYGGQRQGISSAARFYFGKDPGALKLIEVASIVGITNNPSMYDPYYSSNRASNLNRAKLIVQKMFELNMISREEYDEAMAVEELEFSFSTTSTEDTSNKNVQSYYVDTVIQKVLADLKSTYNVSTEIATKMLYQGGYKIYIPMDITVQNVIDSYYENRDNFPNATIKDPETGKVEQLQSAMVIMDFTTGDVVGMAGGIGKKEHNLGFNRATSAFRQVGSVIKPIAVYGLAVELNIMDGNGALSDMPNSAEGRWPVNYEDYYRGLMPLRRALAMSLNGPTVELATLIGPETSYDFLEQACNFKTLTPDGPNTDKTLSLSLGGVTKGLTVTDICASYQMFANDGIYSEPRYYTRVLDNLGNVVLEKQVKSKVAISPQTAFIMRDLFYELVYNGYSSASRFSTSSGEKITCYGKTGTSARDHDLWYCGFTSEYVACVWMGFDSNAVIKTAQSVAPATLWSKVLRSIYNEKGLHDGSFNTPTGVEQVEYCKYSGKIATDVCKLDPRNTSDKPVVMTSWVKSENVPTETCDVHHAVYICEDSGKIAHENCPDGKVYAVAFLNVFRDFVRTDLYIEDSQYTMPKSAVTPETVLFVDNRLPAYFNIYGNDPEMLQHLHKTRDQLLLEFAVEIPENATDSMLNELYKSLELNIHHPGLVMSKFADEEVMNAVCQAHTPAEEPHFHEYNFMGGPLITTPTHEPEPEPEPENPDNPDNPENPENPDSSEVTDNPESSEVEPQDSSEIEPQASSEVEIANDSE